MKKEPKISPLAGRGIDLNGDASTPLVIVESPYKGDNWLQTERNLEYARACMHDCFKRGEYPWASHLLYPQCLDDKNAEERALGIAAGLAWGKCADKTVVYDDLGISDGMRIGIERAESEKRPVEYRRLGGAWASKEGRDRLLGMPTRCVRPPGVWHSAVVGSIRWSRHMKTNALNHEDSVNPKETVVPGFPSLRRETRQQFTTADIAWILNGGEQTDCAGRKAQRNAMSEQAAKNWLTGAHAEGQIDDEQLRLFWPGEER